MTEKVLGIGNALVDVLIRIKDDAIIQDFGLKKGGMILIDQDQRDRILNQFSPDDMVKSAGGSVANTMDALAMLGIGSGFVGKIGFDELGKSFQTLMRKGGVKTHLTTGLQSTGTSMVLISSDSERTFGTFLGAAGELEANDLPSGQFKGYHLLYLEGYLLPIAPLIKKSLQLAEVNQLKVALDLSSFTVVEAHLPSLKTILKNSVDIVFANEDEAGALTGLADPEEALEQIYGYCKTVVLKTGARGSLIKADGRVFRINTPEVDCVDTTGAGDLYAAGFFYGLVNGYDWETCGKIGTILGSQVIQVIGAKMDKDRWQTIKNSIAELVK